MRPSIAQVTSRLLIPVHCATSLLLYRPAQEQPCYAMRCVLFCAGKVNLGTGISLTGVAAFQGVRPANLGTAQLVASGWGFAARLPDIDQLLRAGSCAAGGAGLAHCCLHKLFLGKQAGNVQACVYTQTIWQPCMTAEHSIAQIVSMPWLRLMVCFLWSLTSG